MGIPRLLRFFTIPLAILLLWAGVATGSGAPAGSSAPAGSPLWQGMRSTLQSGRFQGRAAALGVNGLSGRQSSGFSLADVEPNDTPAHAENLTANTTMTGSLNPSSDQVDWYKISLQPGDILNLAFSSTGGSDDDIYFYDPTGEPSIYSNRYGDTQEQFISETDTTGNHFIELDGYVAPGAYEMVPRVTTDSTGTDVLDFSKGFAVARLGSGSDTKDGYSVPIPSGERRAIYLSCDHDLTFRPHVTVYDAGDNKVAEGSALPWADSIEFIDYAAPGNIGPFRLDVEPGATGAGSGWYELDVLFTAEMTRTSSAAPATITYGQSVPFTGHVAYSGPYDHAGTEVHVWRYGSAYDYGHAHLDSLGNYVVSAKPGSTGQYRALWQADSDHDWKWTDLRPIGVRAKVSLSAPTRARRGSTVRLSAKVAPKHSGAVYFQKKVGTSWRTIGHAHLNSLSACGLNMTLTRSTRVRAYFKGDSTHLKGTSSSRLVTAY